MIWLRGNIVRVLGKLLLFTHLAKTLVVALRFQICTHCLSEFVFIYFERFRYDGENGFAITAPTTILQNFSRYAIGLIRRANEALLEDGLHFFRQFLQRHTNPVAAAKTATSSDSLICNFS